MTNTDGLAIGKHWIIHIFLDYIYDKFLYCIVGNVDYVSGPYNVTFPAGVKRVSFIVLINDDNILEHNEDLILTINQSSLPGNVTVGNPDQAIITIVDDDCK